MEFDIMGIAEMRIAGEKLGFVKMFTCTTEVQRKGIGVLASTLIKKWANNTKCLSFITCDWLTAKFQQ